MYLPEQDRFSHSKQHLESNISSLYGGRIAEEVIYGSDKVSTGASNDIERATSIARKMVTQWGLSEKLGPMLFAEEEGEVFLGRTSSKSLHMSDETAKLIDEEIKLLISRNYDRAENLIRDNLDILHAMKDALMKYETIDALQIDDLMARVDVRKPADWDDSDSSSSSDSSKGGSAKKAVDPETSTTPDLSEPSSDTPAK
jgi:cell division protease FtsH